MVDQHVERDQPDLLLVLDEELGVAGALLDRLAVLGRAERGDDVRRPFACRLGTDLLGMVGGEMGVQRPDGPVVLAERTLHGVPVPAATRWS
ncbi:MAG: hypothetical protein L0K86_28785, partial [Actinomycetia bacterium]|nr:hypothetical protein [Actinomycetes bacterium]